MEKTRFENLWKAAREHEAEKVAHFEAELKDTTAAELLNSWFYREQMTPGVFDQMKKAEQDAPAPEDLQRRMVVRYARKEAKSTQQRIEKIAAAEEATLPPRVTIGVEWHRSQVWGWNPRATVSGWQVRTFDSASGCGYDKESAAIAGAFNQNPEIMRILYAHAERGGAFPYGVHVFAGVPSFEGGCGVSVFDEIFKACGYAFRAVASGKMFNAYTIEKK